MTAPKEKPEDLFRAIADATYDWESWVSERGKLLWVNPAVERMTGYSVEECLRMKTYPLPLVHGEDRQKLDEILASAKGGLAGNDVELRLVRKDGTVRWAAISWQAFRGANGRRKGYRTSVRDIHERKLAEERLRDALVLVEQAAAARNEFLANVSHELRTPVQCILGYTQLLRAEETDPERARKLDTIGEQTDHLLAIIANVLDMAALQVATPELVPEDFDLREKLASLVTGSLPLASQKGLTLHSEVATDVPQIVRGDRLRTRQILTNLLSNAIKFTTQGSVTLRAYLTGSASPGSTVNIVFEVEDTGIGVSEDARERIFEPFVQANRSIARRFGGTGLGLPIARRLCEAMGGSLTFTSTENVGSCFRATLPFELSSTEGDRSPASAPRGVSRDYEHLRVLVVDDGPAVRELTCQMLTTLGTVPVSAASGREAVSAANSQQFDLILMDLQMPDLDGLTAAQLIRAHQPEGHIRPWIVALTADSFGRALALGPSGGMDGFLVKPVRLSDLRALLDRFAAPLPSKSLRVLAEAMPVRPAQVLDERVLRDLTDTRNRDGKTLLELTGPRVLADTEALLAAFHECVGSEDARAASQLAHRIKGNCLVIGATEAAQVAQAIDDLAQAGDLASAKVAQVRLDTAFSQAKAALEQALSTLSA